MKEIKNVLICGLGGIGCVCASNIFNNKSANLKILINKDRWEKYTNNPTVFNGITYNFDYVLPSEKDYSADLIIIATKDDGLNEAINNIKNFVNENTIIVSLLNGIHSEGEIAKKYGEKNILYSFYIGVSCIRKDRTVTQNGDYNIVLGAKYDYQKDILISVDDFFTKSGIKHYVSENILDEYWKKFIINVGINQLSAATGKTLNQIRNDKELTNKMLTLMQEAEQIAEKEEISNHKRIYEAAVKFLLNELPDANPSMLQDINSGRKTEVDIFAGKIIASGKRYNIKTPANDFIYKKIKELELKKI
jgi:2-dehydropantoate 2-reductase